MKLSNNIEYKRLTNHRQANAYVTINHNDNTIKLTSYSTPMLLIKNNKLIPLNNSTVSRTTRRHLSYFMCESELQAEQNYKELIIRLISLNLVIKNGYEEKYDHA